MYLNALYIVTRVIHTIKLIICKCSKLHYIFVYCKVNYMHTHTHIYIYIYTYIYFRTLHRILEREAEMTYKASAFSPSISRANCPSHIAYTRDRNCMADISSDRHPLH